MTDTCSRAACADSYRHLWSRKLNGYGRSYPRYSQVFAFYQGGYAIFTTFALNHTSVVKSYMKVIKIRSHIKHHGVKISQLPSDWTTATRALEGIKCLGQVWKKIDFYLIWYIKGEWDKGKQRKSKRGTWRAINFPVVSSMAAAPFHILPIRTFPNQRNTSPSLKWRQLRSLTFPLAPKLCRLQHRYTKKKAMGCTAGGTLVLVGGKKKKSHVEIFWLSARSQKNWEGTIAAQHSICHGTI